MILGALSVRYQLLSSLLGCSAAVSQRRISQSALSCDVTWPPALPLPFEWWDFRMCFLRSKLRQKPLEQMAQVNGLTSLCVCMWNVRLYTCTDDTCVTFSILQFKLLLLARLMDQYCFAHWRLSSVVVCRRL